MSSEEMENALGLHLLFVWDAYPGFIDTIKLIFRSFPERQEEIFNFVHDARRMKDTEYLAEISRIVGFKK
jgi:hypothetical protein